MATTLSKNWNINENYWELNPMMLSIKVFNDFYKKDKSKNKEQSSTIMWGIALLIDPNEHNPWRNIIRKDKEKSIIEDNINIKGFNWESVEYLIDEYELRCLSIPERELVRIERKLVDRSDFIEQTPYSLDYHDINEEGVGKLIKGTAKQLDDLILNTEKMYIQIESIKDRIKSGESAKEKGGIKLSASERGEI